MLTRYKKRKLEQDRVLSKKRPKYNREDWWIYLEPYLISDLIHLIAQYAEWEIYQQSFNLTQKWIKAYQKNDNIGSKLSHRLMVQMGKLYKFDQSCVNMIVKTIAQGGYFRWFRDMPLLRKLVSSQDLMDMIVYHVGRFDMSFFVRRYDNEELLKACIRQDKSMENIVNNRIKDITDKPLHKYQCSPHRRDCPKFIRFCDMAIEHRSIPVFCSLIRYLKNSLTRATIKKLLYKATMTFQDMPYRFYKWFRRRCFLFLSSDQQYYWLKFFLKHDERYYDKLVGEGIYPLNRNDFNLSRLYRQDDAPSF